VDWSRLIKTIFTRGGAPTLLTILLILLALVFMVLDRSSPGFHRFRAKLALVVWPVQKLVDEPIKAVHWVTSSMTRQHLLLEENAQLRAEQALLRSKLQKMLILEKENDQLKQLLSTKRYVGDKVKVAQLLAVDQNPALQQFVVDKGNDLQTYTGQPVLDAYGVMGQIVEVGPLTSKVMMLTDPKSAIPVSDYNTGLRAIAIGMGESGKLELMNIMDASQVKKGDLFVTSGLGLHYPVGYPVGVVSDIEKQPGQNSAKITLLPTAHLSQTQQVLLVWPSQAKLMKAVRKQLAKTQAKEQAA